MLISSVKVPAVDVTYRDTTVQEALDNISKFSRPESFGAVPNDPNVDCAPAINAAIATGTLELAPGATYYVRDEVVLVSNLVYSTNGATIKAATGVDWAGKAVVRASTRPVGVAPDLTQINQQVRKLRHVGSLNIDANGVAPYGFYGWGVVAESVTDAIYVYNAGTCGIVLMGSWYHNVGTLMSADSRRGVSIGYGLEGENDLGDTFVNSVNIQNVNAYNTTGSAGLGYDPYGNLTAQLIGAGVVLGRALASSIGVMTCENTTGAGLVTCNAVNWEIGSLYFEKVSLDATFPGETTIGLLSSTANVEEHAITIHSAHFGATSGVYTRNEAQEFVRFGNIYRFDNQATWRSDSKVAASSMDFGNYYVLNAYGYAKPPQVVADVAPEVVLYQGMLFIGDYGQPPQLPFLYLGGQYSIHLASPNGSVLGWQLNITSDAGDEFVAAGTNPYRGPLNNARTVGNTYYITMANPTGNASQLGSITILRQREGVQWLS